MAVAAAKLYEPYCWNCGRDPEGRKVLTVAEAAKYCGVSRASIYRWMSQNRVLWLITAAGRRRIYRDSLIRRPERVQKKRIALVGGVGSERPGD
jgi:excisionase family DNA binding protein